MKRLICQISVVLLIGWVYCTTSSAQKLSPDEQKIVSYIDAHKSEAIALSR